MKTILNNIILSTAIFISVIAHAILLAVHFVDIKKTDLPPVDPGLEIILVNAKSEKKPLKAEAIAQANLEGGGAHDKGRAKSFLPDMNKVEQGESVLVAQKRIEELEEKQKKLVDQIHSDANFKSQKQLDNKPNDNKQHRLNGEEQSENAKALARSIAEISQTIEDQNKRPRKTFLSPSTQAAGHALYYKALQKKIESVGTINFPQKDGKKLYGEVIVFIPIFQDGTIYEKNGGPKVEKSSGNKNLDAAALRIVRTAAPYGNFPDNMRSKDKDDIWIVVTRFKFTRDQQLETEMRGGVQ